MGWVCCRGEEWSAGVEPSPSLWQVLGTSNNHCTCMCIYESIVQCTTKLWMLCSVMYQYCACCYFAAEGECDETEWEQSRDPQVSPLSLSYHGAVSGTTPLSRTLVLILQESQSAVAIAVAAHDLGEYVRYYPRGKKWELHTHAQNYSVFIASRLWRFSPTLAMCVLNKCFSCLQC